MPTKPELDAMRKKVEDDPSTRQLAEAVGMPFADYVELVMKFAANPTTEPQIMIVDDQILQEQFGYTRPDIQQMVDQVNEHLEALEISTKSKFVDASSRKEMVSGAIPTAPPATASPGEVREDLKAELDKQVGVKRTLK